MTGFSAYITSYLLSFQSQRTINSFFQPEVYMQPAKMKSKRLQNVVNKFMNPTPAETDVTATEDNEANGNGGGESAKQVKGKRKFGVRQKGKKEAAQGVDEGEMEGIDDAQTKTKKPGGRPKRTTKVNQPEEKTEIKHVEENKIVQNETVKVKRNIDKDSMQQIVRKDPVKDIGEDSDISMPSLESGSESDSSSDSDSSVEISDKTSDDEIEVISSGLNIDEILGMRMGNEGEKQLLYRKSDKDTRVFENSVNVEEILKLKGKTLEDISEEHASENEDSSMEKEIFGEVKESMDDVIDVDEEIENELEEIKPEIDYSMEGGFLHEDDKEDIKSLADVKEQVEETIKESIVIDFDKIQAAKDIATDGDKPDSAIVKIEQVDDEFENKASSAIVKPRTRSQRQVKEKKEKKTVVIDACVDKKTVIKTEPDETVKVEGDQKDSDNTKRGSRTRSSTKKGTVTSVYFEDPIKPVVKSFPWADRGKGKRKGPTAKGRGRKLVPEEMVVKAKSKDKQKKEIISVNLSESDSD